MFSLLQRRLAYGCQSILPSVDYETGGRLCGGAVKLEQKRLSESDVEADEVSFRAAIWSNSAFLSWVQHSYLGAALQAQLLENVIDHSSHGPELEAALAQSRRWTRVDPRGYRDLMAHFELKPAEPGSR